MDKEKDQSEEMFNVIFVYTREMALADGVLVDVSELAKEAGIRYPVAVTNAVWQEYVEIPEGVEGQDKTGRLWDILWMFRFGASKATKHEFNYELYVRNDNKAAKLVTLKAHIGPGDQGEPVITIMLPNED